MTCQHCGTAFETTANQPARYCSATCKGRAARTRRPGDYKKTTDKVCRACGIAYRGQPRSVYCGRSCVARSGWQSGRLKPAPKTHDRLDYRLRKDYGISRLEYEAMLEAQNGGCAICGESVRDAISKHRLCVDHCHDTGRIRGLLCGHCNRGIGFFRDSADLLERARQYVAT